MALWFAGEESFMLQQAVDFRAEAEALHALLVTLDDADWGRPTLFKAWTVNDIVQHLHESDLMAANNRTKPAAASQDFRSITRRRKRSRNSSSVKVMEPGTCVSQAPKAIRKLPK